MTTVREASFDLFREHGMTTMFGNPGSTELPMLADFPDGLPLRARPAGGGRGRHGRRLRPGLRPHDVANLHTAPGVGNAMGAIFNAQANHSPVLITAGQQVAGADHPAGQPDQPRRDPDAAPAGQVGLRAGRAPRTCRWPSPTALHLAGAAAARARLRLDPDGRLVRRGRRGRRPRGDRPPGDRPRRRRPRGGPGPRRAPRRRLQPGPRRRPRHRRLAAPGTRRSPSPSASACRSGPARRPAAAASASPRATRTSAASCRRRSARSARRSRATT